jgi:hypothetical protein
MAEHPNFTLTKDVWDKINVGDYSTALDDVRDDVIVDNGPGAGPWRHIEGKEAYVEMMMGFLPLFGDTWKQEGKVVYADDQLTIVLVHETGTTIADLRARDQFLRNTPSNGRRREDLARGVSARRA